jgi:glycosyltransferase involved in cell wall biosynthesis
MKELKLSIITVVKNDENNIENTIKSVLSQKSKLTFEYIVLDGGSTDQTFNIIKKYKNKIDFIQSESDRGLYHALNRAVRLSKGKYIASTLIPKNFFKNGSYAIKIAIGVHNVRWIVFDDRLMIKFTVTNIDGLNSAFLDSRPGLIMPNLVWEKRNQKNYV